MANNFLVGYNKRIQELYKANASGEIAPGRILLHSIIFDWFFHKEKIGIDPELEEYRGNPDDYEAEYILIGDWQQDKASYIENKNGKFGFSAIYFYATLEFKISYSKWYSLGYQSSPATMDCVNLEAPGVLKGFCLPKDTLVNKGILQNFKEV